uniref:G_PROTEIN_RECEP_F1_2 domain-containing protein n=1 Tax=Panagrellus redivivus TaxID=6233 RepID=A0A7E4W047_PANRE
MLFKEPIAALRQPDFASITSMVLTLVFLYPRYASFGYLRYSFSKNDHATACSTVRITSMPQSEGIIHDASADVLPGIPIDVADTYDSDEYPHCAATNA